MPLFYRELGTPCESAPSLVFLHGFLGDGGDWQAVVNALSLHHHCVLVDLPAHGNSRDILVQDFAESRNVLKDTLAVLNRPFILIGYSLGGRVAMDLMAHELLPQQKGLIVEGGHFGLPEGERDARLRNDAVWAERFAQEDLPSVLADWYRQPVFASVPEDIKAQWRSIRAKNDGKALAKMLQATSLANQTELLPKLMECNLPKLYVCGEQDVKFRALADNSPFDVALVARAGHNAHFEQPLRFVERIISFVKQVG